MDHIPNFTELEDCKNFSLDEIKDKCVYHYIAKCWNFYHEYYKKNCKNRIEIYIDFFEIDSKVHCKSCLKSHIEYNEECDKLFTYYNKVQKNYLYKKI
ncbi:hypothetical protein HZS_784 [Henneguya salminicola]|nr:hypothetical protein HZS_784 [Henneguya salminicola]